MATGHGQICGLAGFRMTNDGARSGGWSRPKCDAGFEVFCAVCSHGITKLQSKRPLGLKVQGIHPVCNKLH